MLDTFFLTLSNVGQMLFFMVLGYALRRTRNLPENAGNVLSRLCVLVFLPAYTIVNLSKNFTIAMLTEKLQLFGAGVLFMAAIIAVGYPLARALGRNSIEKKSLTYAFTFPNYSYFGYPVVEGVFGNAMLGNFMVFLIPTALACNTYGYILFQENKKGQFWKLLLSPIVLSQFVGVLVGLSGIVLPGIVTNTLTVAGNCMSPCSMLVGGFMLGKFSPKELLTEARAYLLTAIRMLAIPLVFGGLLYLIGVRGEVMFLATLTVSLPLGMNLVVFPESLGYEEAAQKNARLCFVSYCLALVLLPITFSLLTKLCM